MQAREPFFGEIQGELKYSTLTKSEGNFVQKPSVQVISKIAKVLGVQMEDLVNNNMRKVKVTSGMTMSLDGFTAGSNQSFEKPFGDNFDSDLLDRWMFAEPEKHKHRKEIDAILDAGAFIMGKNMFGPKGRRDKPEWKGWWGDNPPYHAPVSCSPTRSANQ
jgi:hypothetical protein